jgi:hypothetical protein
MEYAAAAKSAYFLARDVYFGSRWVYQTVQSAGRKHSELEALREEFHDEFSTIFAFCYNFLRNPDDPVTTSPAFQALLPKATKVLRNLQTLYSTDDLGILALEDDQEYAAFKKKQTEFRRHGTGYVLLNPDATWLLEAPPMPPSTQLLTAGPSTATITGSNNSTIARPPVSTTLSAVTQPAPKKSFSFSWPLRDKPKLQSLLKKVRVESRKLESLTPQFLAIKIDFSNMQAQDMFREFFQQHQSAGHLGIWNHLAIREIASEVETIPSSPTDSEPGQFDFTPKLEDLDLGLDCELEPQNALALSQGKLTQPGKSTMPVLVEYKKWRMTNDKDHKMETENEIHRLARVLATAGTLHLSTLEFRGFIEQEQEKRYAFVFDYPRGAGIDQPITLNNILGNTSAGSASLLPFRFNMAQILAESLGAFHSDGWVHKSVCSQSVVFFNDHNSKPIYRKPYLVNFEYARPATSVTTYASNEDPARRVYVHPDRQPGSSTKFNAEHELYSLGVVLLEIGLWKTASNIRNDSIGYKGHTNGIESKTSKDANHLENVDDRNEEEENEDVDDGDDDDSETQSDDWQSAEDCDETRSSDTTPFDDTLQDAASESGEEILRAESELTREAFIDAAKKELPDRMGPSYAEAVQACLSAEFASNLRQVKLGIPVIREVIGLLSPDHLKLEI